MPILQKLAYQRGGLLAATWDSRIRRQSQGKQSLDDAMLSLRKSASAKEQLLTESFLGDHFARFARESAQRPHNYIDNGEIILCPPALWTLRICTMRRRTHTIRARREKMVQTQSSQT